MSLISVIIPYRDAEKYISFTLESLIAQTYSDFELICVDNDSSDNGPSIVGSLRHRLGHSLKSLHFPKAGKSLALNYAISEASGDWIAICDADDLWTHDKLEKQIEHISNDRDIIGTQMKYIDASGKQAGIAPQLPISNPSIYHSILHKKENPICNSSVMYRKSIHTDVVGFYDPQCEVEDYDMWSRCMFADLKFFNVDKALVLHRLHENSNFNSSNKQAVHKALVDAKNGMLQQIRMTTNRGN